MRVGVVAEGPCDIAVMRVVLRAIFDGEELQIAALQPDPDRLRYTAGWQAVQKFLLQSGPLLLSERRDLLLVCIDADVRGKVGVLPDPVDGDGELDSLCRLVQTWVGAPPASLVVAIPREQTDAWLLAVHTRLRDVEAVSEPKVALVERGLLPPEPRERTALLYERLAAPLAALVRKPKELARVPELERLIGKLRRRQRAIRKAQRERD